MANEISSQITSVVQNQAVAKPTEKAPLSAVPTAGNRQETVAAQNQPLQNAKAEVASPEKVELEQAVSDINDYVQTVNRELQFRVDDALPLGRSVVTVIDTDTEETIREFPSEQALALAQQIKDQSGEATQGQIAGLIISAQA